MYTVIVKDFADWRIKARTLLYRNIEPLLVFWQDAKSFQNTLFEEESLWASPIIENKKQFFIPGKFLAFAELLACHRDNTVWEKLYHLLWRLCHGEKQLMELNSDPLIHNLHLMHQSIKRDAHKMKAFVRFCKFNDEHDQEYFLAWYKPDHLIVRLVAPFFQRRFEIMRWTIVTPDETVTWDGEYLVFSEGKNITTNPQDALEDLWRTYYKAIFNPARVKVNAMKREMPVRFWHNLPETQMISTLLRDASARVQTMMAHQEGLISSAADFLPKHTDSLKKTSQHALKCQGCPIHLKAKKTVFGSGNHQARLILVGEQPGEQEELAGEPFIGSAGQLLDAVLQFLNIKRAEIYLTYAIKHFKYELQGDFKVHKSPSIQEINACKPWLLKEIELVKPKVILCLGLTAAKSLINPAFRIKQERGKLKKETDFYLGATHHPSAILRAPTAPIRDQLIETFTEDLKKAFLLSGEYFS